jgi:mannitol/fructose-specific phosphotransferase system IIA component
VRPQAPPSPALRRARLIFVLVSPAERAEEHLRSLARIATVLFDPAETSRLLERYAPEATLDWLHVDE